MFRSVAIAFGVYVLAAVFAATWVYFDSLESALSRDREAGLVRLSEATSRLRGQLDVYRALVNVIARNPEIAAAYDPAADISEV